MFYPLFFLFAILFFTFLPSFWHILQRHIVFLSISRKKKEMGNKHVICNHPHLDVRSIRGPENLRDTLFVIEFAHLTCSDCNMNCYGYNTHSRKPKWIRYVPSTEEEKTYTR